MVLISNLIMGSTRKRAAKGRKRTRKKEGALKEVAAAKTKNTSGAGA